MSEPAPEQINSPKHDHVSPPAPDRTRTAHDPALGRAGRVASLDLPAAT